MLVRLHRREALALMAALTATASQSHAASDAAEEVSSRFQHGVASGDPDSTSLVIWTRVTPAASAPDQPLAVTWRVARDQGLTDIVATGESVASPKADFTVKDVVEGLEPGQTYFYGFVVDGEASPIGRTRTLPVGALGKLGIALASCSNYAYGHFNAYDAIAKDPQVDIVLHTGDYIYEYGAGEWGDDVGTLLGRRHQPPHETVTLTDYRLRHAQYKSDPGAQAMHAAHPFVACWDDHESTNNPWMGGAQNHQPDTEGDWSTRRAAAIQAYFEWMPVREPSLGRSRADFWRVYRFGDLATLVTLETRHTGRGEQVAYGPWFERLQTAQDRDAFMSQVIGDPDRGMLSPAMEADLRSALADSKATAQPWRILGNASPMARMLVPDVAALGIDPRRNVRGAALGQSPDLFWTGRWNLPFYTDTWDGYPAARERLYELCKGIGVEDLLVLTGDSHSFWMNRLFDGRGRPMGLELGTAGISSPGDFVESGWDMETAARLDRLFETHLDEVVWTDNLHQGYVRVVLEPHAATADFIAVDTVLTKPYRATVLRSTRIVRINETLAYAAPDA